MRSTTSRLSRNPLKIRASLGREAVVWNSGENGRNPLKIRASLGLEGGTSYYTIPSGRNPLKIRASLGPRGLIACTCTVWSQSLKDQGKSRTIQPHSQARAACKSRNPLKIRASLGLWTAWHSHVDSRFHCANIRHKREEKVAGPKLIHIKSLLAF